MDDSRDDQVGAITYRGITITRHSPVLFRDKRGRTSLATCSFSVGGVSMVASSLAKAHELIDKALGPPS